MPEKVVKQKILRGVKFGEFSAVDVGAHEGAGNDIEKAANKKKLTKALDITLAAYFYGITDDWELEWAIDTLNRLVNYDIPAVAEIIRMSAEKMGMEELLPSEGPVAALLAKSKGDSSTKEATMPEKKEKSAEELTKELKASQDKVAELQKQLDAKDETPEVVYKASNGKIYKGDQAEQWKEIDAVKSDMALEKRALVLPGVTPENLEKSKSILKALEGIEDEEQRKAAIERQFPKVDEKMAKRYLGKGSVTGDPEATPEETPLTKANKLIKERIEATKEDYPVARRAVLSDNPGLAEELLGLEHHQA